MEIPLISVIVPMYNVEAYIEECITSLLEQNYPVLEFILVDDGSTDHTAEKIRQLTKGDPRFTYFFKEHSGISDTRNVGLRMAQGKLVYWLDADDKILDNSIERLYHALFLTDADIAISDYVRYKDGVFHYHSDNRGDVEVLTSEQAIHNLSQYRDQISTTFTTCWNTLYKRSLFEGLEFPSGKYFEDCFIIWKIYQRAEKIAYVHRLGYAYRINPDSILQKYDLHHLDKLEALEERMRVLKCQAFSMDSLYELYKNELARQIDLLQNLGNQEATVIKLEQKLERMRQGDDSFLS